MLGGPVMVFFPKGGGWLIFVTVLDMFPGGGGPGNPPGFLWLARWPFSEYQGRVLASGVSESRVHYASFVVVAAISSMCSECVAYCVPYIILSRTVPL